MMMLLNVLCYFRQRTQAVAGIKYIISPWCPSIEVAAKIANALEVSLDYLAGNTDQLLEKNIVRRISDIQQLPQDDKAHLFALRDAFLRDHKAKKAYAS
jgi:hypothetical protein